MKINHYRPFFSGLLCLTLALGCALLGLHHGFQLRHGMGMLLLLALGGVNLWFALSKNSMEEELRGAADERDLFIAAKSGQLTAKIMNWLLFSAALLAFLCYGVTRQVLWMAVGIALCAAVVVLFAVLLCANAYYEKKF